MRLSVDAASFGKQFYKRMTMMRWTRERGGGVVVAMKQMLYTNDIAMNFIYHSTMPNAIYQEKAGLYTVSII